MMSFMVLCFIAQISDGHVSPTANGSQSGGPCARCDTTGGERARVKSAPTEHRENGME